MSIQEMKKFILFGFWVLVVALGLSSCKGEEKETVRQEDLNAKQMLQGIWMDDSDMAFMRISGDSLYYADPENLPVTFFIIQDSLYIVGSDTISYPIVKQTPNLFDFKMIDGSVVQLYKYDSDEDELAFGDVMGNGSTAVQERLEKDSVVVYGGQRYRGYVYINPSTMKVYKQSVNSVGMMVENVYYDNVIHICVYTGTKLLYGSDITKNFFADYLPDDFLSGAILSDMDFEGVDSEGFHYSAEVSQPESPLYYQFHLTIDKDNEVSITED